MDQGDEKEDMLRKLEKKSKKSNKNAATSGLGGESDGCEVKKKKKRKGGEHPGKCNKDNDEDVVKYVERKKNNKLKKSCLNEPPLDFKISAPASASEMRDSEKVVETLGEISSGDVVDEIRRKKKSKKNIKTTNVVGVANTDIEAKTDDCDLKRKKEKKHGKHSEKFNEDSDEVALRIVEGKKSRKLKKSRVAEQEKMHDTEDVQEDIVAEVDEGDISSPIKIEEKNRTDNGNIKKRKKVKSGHSSEDPTHEIEEKNRRDNGNIKKRKKVKSGHSSEDPTHEIEEENRTDNGNIKKKKKVKSGHSSEDPTHEKSAKKVRFSGHVQIFPSSDDPSDEKHEIEDENLLRGKRFSKLEDEIVKEAVHKYVDLHNLGEEGLKKILNSRSYPEIKGCWKEIGSAIPYRPYTAVYYRAQILFRRSESRKWTEEEYEIVRKFQKEHGNNWKVLADELGKHRFHVKDTWRRIKRPNQNKGQWTQEEYQSLFDLVNTDLRLRLSEEKRSKYGMLRDNIAWTAISDKLSTRTEANCCLKWYDQLTSPMVAKGEWADVDDYRLVDALFELDASCIEDVDWDNLLDHRPGEICRKRWNQMVLHIGKLKNSSFAEQIEVLAKRYRPDFAEVREAWDNKPVVP
ncbi:RNA polymerase I termination factor [Capsicum annuum]|uniref:RNA polymerase I termination factor n=1 Tax=Capsicum annuum TaxID=4072 RepID=UPI001FB0BBC4|nr:RNA polymerase I termination factor [Capsicum annuum]